MNSQVKKILLASLLILAVFAPRSLIAEPVGAEALNYNWGSKRIDATLWGVAAGDVNGDGREELVLLEKNSIWIGRREGTKLVKDAEYRWNSMTHGLRIYALDLDGDRRDEIIVSAVANAVPASFIFSFDGQAFTPLHKDIPWHVRVLEKDGEEILIGQRSTPDNYFTGKLYPLSWNERGKLVHEKKLRLPRWTKIFDFAMMPPRNEQHVLVSLKGFAPLRAYELRGRRWKRFWTSQGRFGGTMRTVTLLTRPSLQDLPEYVIPIDREPIAFSNAGIRSLIAARHDLPLRNMIARRTLIKGGSMVIFNEDDALGFSERYATKRLPGYIADYCILRGPTSGRQRLVLALQNDPDFFQPSAQSSVLIFEIPAGRQLLSPAPTPAPTDTEQKEAAPSVQPTE